MTYLHWNCQCGAHGYSNMHGPEKIIIDRHRREGHTVEVWMRGHRDRAESWRPLQENNDPAPA